MNELNVVGTKEVEIVEVLLSEFDRELSFFDELLQKESVKEEEQTWS